MTNPEKLISYYAIVDWGFPTFFVALLGLIGTAWSIKKAYDSIIISQKSLEINEHQKRILNFHNKTRFLIRPCSGDYTEEQGARLYLSFQIINCGEVPVKIRNASIQYDLANGMDKLDFTESRTLKPEASPYSYGGSIGGGEKIEKIIQTVELQGKCSFKIVLEVFDILTDSYIQVERYYGALEHNKVTRYAFIHPNVEIEIDLARDTIKK